MNAQPLLVSLVLWAAFFLVCESQYCKPYCSPASCPSGVAACTTCSTPYSYDSTGPRCALTSTSLSVFASELAQQSSFSFSGYTSNGGMITYGCSTSAPAVTYYMLGPFVANNFVYKAFTGLGVSHYQADVFWTYGIFGSTWSGQGLSATFLDGNGLTSSLLNQPQTCGSPSAFTGSCSGGTGCFRSYKQTIAHNTDFLSLNFSSVGAAISTVSSIQSWAINDLVIVLSKCDSTCLTCSGSSSNNCLSCNNGLFLRGSVCVLVCPFYTIPSNRTCVTSCPAYFYTSTFNNFCESCPLGCQTCTNSTQCADWAVNQNPKSTVIELLPLWIILSVLGLVLIAVLLWKCCCSSKSFYDKMEDEVIDHKSQPKQMKRPDINHSHETMEARWIDDIDDLHKTKIESRRVKPISTGIQGIGKELSMGF